MKWLLLATFLIFNQVAYTQQKFIDNLKHELSNAKQDTGRVLILLDLCNSYRNSKPDSALKYGQQAQILAEQIKFLRGESRALSNLGFVLREIGNLPKALEVTMTALSIAEDNHYQREIANAKAMIGNVYYDLKDYHKAIYYWKQSKKIAEDLQDEPQLAIRQVIIGGAYLYTNQLDSAVQYLQPAYRNVVRLKMMDMYPFILRNLGLLENKLGNNKAALAYCRQSVQAARQINDHRNAAFTYNLIASFYQQQNQLDSSIIYAENGLVEARLGPFNARILESSSLLADNYRTKQDFKQAFFYLDLMLKTKESLFGAGNIQAMQTIIANEEKRKREVEVSKEAFQNQVRQVIFIGVLLILLLIAFFLYRNNRQKQEANVLLHQQRDEINERSLELQKSLKTLQSTQAQLIQKEKLASLGELTAGIAHEIQNPLNFVNNFSELSVELIEELGPPSPDGGAPEAPFGGWGAFLADITQNLEKINHHGKRASSIVKGMLEHSRQSTGERELTDLNHLADEYIRLAYHGLRAKNPNFNCELITEFDPDLPQIEVIPQDMGRVLLNLVNNAFYAVNERTKNEKLDYQPNVTVTTNYSPIRGWGAIRVNDNGTGMSKEVQAKIFQPFFTTKPTGEGTGLGLSLAYDIVTKGHGGTMEVESVEGEGTTFIVKLAV